MCSPPSGEGHQRHEPYVVDDDALLLICSLGRQRPDALGHLTAEVVELGAPAVPDKVADARAPPDGAADDGRGLVPPHPRGGVTSRRPTSRA